MKSEDASVEPSTIIKDAQEAIKRATFFDELTKTAIPEGTEELKMNSTLGPDEQDVDQLDTCSLKTVELNFKRFYLYLYGDQLNFLRQKKHSAKLTVLYTDNIERAQIVYGHKE